MLTSFQDADRELYLVSLNPRDIIESLTLQDVYNFLESLGVDQIVMNEDKQYLICPTICHNPIHEAESMKLYWYHNNKIFRCYTECNEAMSIFELYRRFMALNEYPITLGEAEEYVKQFLQHIVRAPSRNSYAEDLSKYKYDIDIPTLKEYPSYVLDCFTKYYHPLWLKDGISKEAMERFNIRFSVAQNKIIIPHYDINNRLIGIRGRAIEAEDVALGKYRPIQFGDILYAHQLQFNLYGINFHKEGIQKRRTAIIAEGEKSALLDHTYYDSYSNCVACCGSTFNKYHISLLTRYCGANEIIVALDKEYEDWRDEKGKAYRAKLEGLCRKYSSQASFSYIWDYDNVLKEKDSPFDRGQEIFEYLYKNRVKVR